MRCKSLLSFTRFARTSSTQSAQSLNGADSCRRCQRRMIFSSAWRLRLCRRRSGPRVESLGDRSRRDPLEVPLRARHHVPLPLHLEPRVHPAIKRPRRVHRLHAVQEPAEFDAVALNLINPLHPVVERHGERESRPPHRDAFQRRSSGGAMDSALEPREKRRRRDARRHLLTSVSIFRVPGASCPPRRRPASARTRRPGGDGAFAAPRREVPTFARRSHPRDLATFEKRRPGLARHTPNNARSLRRHRTKSRQDTSARDASRRTSRPRTRSARLSMARSRRVWPIDSRQVDIAAKSAERRNFFSALFIVPRLL